MKARSMQPDVIETLGQSTIQHGKYNNRIYLMKVDPDDAPSLPQTLNQMAEARGYSKIFAKVPERCAAPFLDNGFHCEASIPWLLEGRETVVLLSRFLDNDRKESRTADQNEAVLAACRAKEEDAFSPARPDGAQFLQCTPGNADTMAKLYGQVFPTYPFPIDDPNYLTQTMASHVVYFGVWMEERLVALSSAEMDTEGLSVEMTDFATLPEYRGRGLATCLLELMEAEMLYFGILTAYTIARAPSFGMNIPFARRGYEFGGRLINNTNIGGQFEDMNVWHKPLTAPIDGLMVDTSGTS